MEFQRPDKEYRLANNMVFSCQYHVVWCTKYRRKILEGDIAKRLIEIVREKQGRLKYKIIDIEVMTEHVHLLIDVDPNVGVMRTINQIKGATSKMLRQEFRSVRSRLPSLWTRSKFISSVGMVSLDVVRNYINNQKHEHEIYPNRTGSKMKMTFVQRDENDGRIQEKENSGNAQTNKGTESKSVL